MKVSGYYIDKTNGDELCFVCAVKRALTGKSNIIHFETDVDNTYLRCHTCDQYIEDSVEF